jgi:hypothetical protein
MCVLVCAYTHGVVKDSIEFSQCIHVSTVTDAMRVAGEQFQFEYYDVGKKVFNSHLREKSVNNGQNINTD